VFFDAVPADQVTLGRDVLTPHMGGWYEKGSDLNAQNFASVAPGDWHSPVPSPFLVLKKGARLQFGIAPRLTGDPAHDATARAAVAPALDALKDALEWIGAGAKTAAGYGLMTLRPEAQRQSDKDVADYRKKMTDQADKKARIQAKTEMSLADRVMADLFDSRTDTNQDERAVLFTALKAGKLAEHRREAAQRLKTLMQEQKRWREKTEKKNPEKDQPYQDTLLVMKWLNTS
jgi:CRISPR-associated protein Cmr6